MKSDSTIDTQGGLVNDSVGSKPTNTKSLTWLCRLGFHKYSYDHMPVGLVPFTLPWFVCERCGKMEQRL